MHSTTDNKNWFLIFQAFVLSIIIVIVFFLWEGNKGLNLWDEGFLWYGVQRVMLGEVPIRDFQAYDVGRYYWSAILMNLYGSNGIMALRGTIAVLQTIGLFISLYLIALNSKKSFIYLTLSALILMLWMYPQYKSFDILLSIMSIGALTFLIQYPIAKRYFLTGVVIGLITVFARNHGLYGSIASFFVICWLNIKRTGGCKLTKAMLCWLSGFLIGLIPFFLILVVTPGYANAFEYSVRFMIKRGATNLNLPFPWPWKVDIHTLSITDSLRAIIKGVAFIALIVFAGISAFWVSLKKMAHENISAPFVATAFLSIPYIHYAYSRADIVHLALSIFPLLIGVLIFLATQSQKIKWFSLIALLSISIFLIAPNHMEWKCFIKKCVAAEVSGSTLFVDEKTASEIALLNKLVAQYSPEGQNVLITPFWPGAYALFERKSPMWAVYAILPRDDVFEQQEIARIKNAHPSLVVIVNVPLDDRDDLRFKNSHPLIYQYIVDNFEPIPDSPSSKYQLFKIKGSTN